MITRIYCPICKKMEFQLQYKDNDSWYGTCENCHRYLEGTKRSIEKEKYTYLLHAQNYQVPYDKIIEMENIYD